MYERPIIAPNGLTQLTDYDKDDEILVVRDGKVRRKSALVATPTFASRAAAEAASVPAVVMEISYPVTLKVSSGNAIRHVVRFVRDTGSLTAATGALVTADGQVWVPAGDPTPLHFGQDSMGVSSWTSSVPTPYLLSDVFASLAAAQAVYPEAAALTETVDSQAFQKCADYVKANYVQAQGGREVDRGSVNNRAMQVGIVVPQGAYYINRPWNLTGIEYAYSAWNLHFEKATILGETPSKPIIDLTGSRNCQFTGVANIIGLWTANGICRAGIQVGRPNDGTASDGHSFRGARIKIKGRFSLAAFYNYASEYVDFGAMGLMPFNCLDDRVFHCQFDGSDGVKTFTALETVTWSGGSGVVVYRTTDTTTGGVGIRVTSGTLADNTQITGGTSTKVADINGTPIQEPSGEGPDGRSYAIVQDGDNYWELTSDYQTNPAADTAASFLRNSGILDARHSGRGDALWICRAVCHDYTNSYFVSEDADGGAGVVAFSNTSAAALDGLVLDCHIESDGGDTDASTGLDYGIRFDAASTANVVIRGFKWRRNKAQVSLAQFFAGTNVSTVKLYGDIEVFEVGRDDGQVMFSDPSKFEVHGRLSCGEDGTGPFFNVSSLANVSGVVECNDRTSSNVRHATASYQLLDASGNSEFLGGFKMDGADFSYVEGSWTPTLTDGSNLATLSVADGAYTRIGNRVICQGRIGVSSKGSISGGLRIGGLPITSSGTGIAGGGVVTLGTNLSVTAGQNITLDVGNATTEAILYLWDGTAGPSALNATEVTDTTTLRFEITYRV